MSNSINPTMYRILFFSVSIALIFAAGACKVRFPKNLPESPPVSHSLWNDLLQKHVRADGFVHYKGFIQDSTRLNEYLALLSSTHPNKSWSREEQMAYWINVYNAFTVQLIVDYYPVESIKDIKRGIPFVSTVWDIKFIQLQGQTYDLNQIEHGILRPHFRDARIHAAINCASYSCPVLRNEAFTAERLDSQLDDAMRRFVNDPLRNRVSAGKGELSSIFSWFSGDFKKDAGNIRDFVNRYAVEKLGKDAPVSYLDYDWSLNDAGE